MLRSCRNTAKHPDTVRDTWDRILTSLSIRIPRSRTVVEGSTWFSPTRTAAGGRWFCRRVVEHQRISVFAVFSCRRFDRIQSDTSSRQADRVDRSWSADTGRQEPCICISSAYRWGWGPYLSMRSIKPEVYKMNSRGPRTDPCGTPNRTILCVDQAKPRHMHSTLLVTYDQNQSSAAPLIPKETLSHVSRKSWSTVSNAADRSSKARTDRSPSSTAYRMSVSTSFSTAVSVEWCVRYADCRLGKRSAMDR